MDGDGAHFTDDWVECSPEARAAPSQNRHKTIQNTFMLTGEMQNNSISKSNSPHLLLLRSGFKRKNAPSNSNPQGEPGEDAAAQMPAPCWKGHEHERTLFRLKRSSWTWSGVPCCPQRCRGRGCKAATPVRCLCPRYANSCAHYTYSRHLRKAAIFSAVCEAGHHCRPK